MSPEAPDARDLAADAGSETLDSTGATELLADLMAVRWTDLDVEPDADDDLW